MPDSLKSIPENPLVASARYQLQHADKRWLDNGLVWTKGKQFRIGVAPTNIERACHFLNVFLRAVQRRGYRIAVEEKDTLLHLGYQPLPILLRERTRRIQPNDRKITWGSSQLVPSGDLHLHMTYQFKERDWKIGDGALPDEAEAMLDRLESTGQRIDAYYRELEAGWARNEERQRIERQRTERKAAELTGFKKLLQAATRWQQAQFIRNYLAALEQAEIPIDPSQTIPSAETVSDPSFESAAPKSHPPTVRVDYLAWARAKADWYDPLIEAADEWLSSINRDALS